MLRRVAIAGLLWGLGVIALAPPASAHAGLASTDPAAGAQLDRAPAEITLTFTEEPERSLSVVHVLDATGASHEQGKPQAVAGTPRSLRTSVGVLANGVYTVTWRVVSRVDGHATAGSFAFGVGASPAGATPPPSAAVPAQPPPSPLEIAGRWILFLGLAGLLGGAWVSAAVIRDTPRGVRRYAGAGWAAAALGLALLTWAQVRAAGSLADFASTSLGRAVFWRAIALAFAGIALVVAARSEGRRRSVLSWGSALASSGTALAHVAAGHAAAASPAAAEIVAQWVHVVAGSIWIGGLGALLIGVRGSPGPARAAAVRRFSTVAGFALVVVAGTGTVRAFGEISRWGALIDTGYGRVVLVKAGLLVVLAALGAVNRYRNIPRAESSSAGLRAISRAELSVATIVFGAAALLASISPPPPVSAAAPKPAGLVINGSDFATTVRLRLEVTPGVVGSNAFSLRVVDYDTGAPVAADRVSLRFRFLDSSGVADSTLPLAPGDAGTWHASGTNLSLDGRWTVTVVVERGADSVEVPLSLGTRCVTRAVVTPGQPTIYTVDLTRGRTAQLYVDPGRAGLNEVHVTFFEQTGMELPIPATATMTAGTGDKALIPLTVRRFSTGHFVADATLAAGRWRFAFTASATDGGVLRGCFEDTVR